MPNDAKVKLDSNTHRLQDQAKAADPAAEVTKTATSDRRQPAQSQQREVIGTTLPEPADPSDRKSNQTDYGAKTGAALDHPYSDKDQNAPTAPAPGCSNPPDNHTEIDSEADLGDPSDR